MIDEVYLFDRALTEAEIANLAGLAATEDWHVDLALNWTGEGGNTRHSLAGTPGLGFS